MKLLSRAKDFIRDQRAKQAKINLERELSRVLTVMDAHKAAKLRTGHHYYVLLKRKTQDIIAKYKSSCIEIGVPISSEDDIYASVPSLRELDRLSSGYSAPSPIVPIGLGVFILGIAMTTILALYHAWYVLLVHWMIR